MCIACCNGETASASSRGRKPGADEYAAALKPAEFYDLVIQVAIVRPGPIQGDMVHPYLRRRQGREAVSFPAPKPPHDPDRAENVLGKTLGVPLFQEQAMKLAITAANFTPAEATACAVPWPRSAAMVAWNISRAKLVDGMVARGYEADFALRCFNQIKGFGSYGFPKVTRLPLPGWCGFRRI